MRATPSRALAALILAAGLGHIAARAATPPAEAASQPANVVRAGLSKPFTAAQELINANKGQEALAKLKEVEAVGNLSPYESYLLLRMRATAEFSAGQQADAERDFETLLGSDKLPEADRLPFTRALAQMYYSDQKFPQAATWIQRFFDAGGTDPQLKSLLPQAQYMAKDYAAAGKAFQAQVDADLAAGKTPEERTLRLLASAQANLKDDAGYGRAIEQLAIGYPNSAHGHDYLADVVQRAVGDEHLPDRLYLDYYRLKAAAFGQVADSERLSFAAMAARAGYPGEAKRLLDDGIARKSFTGADAGEAAKLRDQVARSAAQDKAQAASNEAGARQSKDGNGLVGMGVLAALDGEGAHGVDLIQQGLAKGSLKYPDEGRLDLGMAQFLAGRFDDAAKTFDGLANAANGVGPLAHAWSVIARSKAHAAAAPMTAGGSAPAAN